ncbi:MAG: hypothetical protein NC548_54340 [Lachnospiraceae bacterium]|nr:hypothetical protein [Lachnospiraceae bacterium]
MKNKIKIAILVISLCLALCSCSYQHGSSLNLYEIYVCDVPVNSDSDRGDVEYNKADRMYSFSKQQMTVKEGETDKQYQIGIESITLKYECTYNKDYCEFYVNSYSNEEYGIKANFRCDNGNLDYLRLGNYKYKIFDGIVDTESKLMEICTNYLLGYVNELAKYDSNIVTKIQTIHDNGLNNQSLAGYVSPLIYNDSSVSYQVDFTYYIEGIKTSDIISMRIDSNGYLELLSFNMIGAFDSFGDCDIDVTRCEQLISSEMTKLCDVDNYQYETYTDTKILIVLGNKLCMLSYAQPIYRVTDDMTDFLTPAIQLLIPVAEQ